MSNNNDSNPNNPNNDSDFMSIITIIGLIIAGIVIYFTKIKRWGLCIYFLVGLAGGLLHDGGRFMHSDQDDQDDERGV